MKASPYKTPPLKKTSPRDPGSAGRIFIGIPACAERQWLPGVLASLEAQTRKDFEVWICVNQPEERARRGDLVYQDNQQTLAWLMHHRHRFSFPLRVMDASSRNQAPQARKSGVGWARRHLFDAIASTADPQDVLISLDADTCLSPGYVSAVHAAFHAYPNALGLAAPFCHTIPPDRHSAVCLLRYEIFLLYYQLSLWRIGSPYAYTPIGSAMAFLARGYTMAGGFPRQQAGEDFYLLQKLRKLGPIIRWIPATAFPSSRPSSRVPFGTGPLLSNPSLTDQRLRFPFYSQDAFSQLEESFKRFPQLFHQDLPLPIDAFIQRRIKTPRPFARLRRNARDQAHFVRACHEFIDALRSFQFLRECGANTPASEAEALNRLLGSLNEAPLPLNLNAGQVETLKCTRDRLRRIQAKVQQRFMAHWDFHSPW